MRMLTLLVDIFFNEHIKFLLSLKKCNFFYYSIMIDLFLPLADDQF